MRVETRIPRLFREGSEELIDMISIQDEDESLDKSSFQGVSTVQSTPSTSFSDAVGNSKNYRSGMPSRRVSTSQPVQSSRDLRPRNETKLSLRRTSPVIQLNSPTDSLVSKKIRPKDTSRKVSVKRKLEGSEDEPRVRKKLPSPSESSESENATPSPSEPLPGRTSDERIDYRYYIAKYLNQRHQNKMGKA
ncbi:hypothetical protein OPQ81_006364 [Rhizoctonia solani]|nr:hypothetical protein OPQ81_006364 [Rhizoctonia solani]